MILNKWRITLVGLPSATPSYQKIELKKPEQILIAILHGNRLTGNHTRKSFFFLFSFSQLIVHFPIPHNSSNNRREEEEEENHCWLVLKHKSTVHFAK